MQESAQITHGFNPQSRSGNKSEIDGVGRSVPVRKSVMCASPASLRSQPPGAARRENRRKNSLQLLILARTRRKVQSWPPHGKRPNPELCAGPHEEEKKLGGGKNPPTMAKPRCETHFWKYECGTVRRSQPARRDAGSLPWKDRAPRKNAWNSSEAERRRPRWPQQLRTGLRPPDDLPAACCLPALPHLLSPRTRRGCARSWVIAPPPPPTMRPKIAALGFYARS